jgi:hypothetical protein
MIRLVAAAPFFALAVFFAIRSWNPLGNGYFSSYRDDPTGLYLTMAGLGASIAALFAATGLVIASRWFRRHGGFLVIATLAILASALPYVLLKWTTRPESWAWAYLVQGWIGWLRFEPRPRSYGIAIQITLALVAVASLGAEVSLRRLRPAGPGHRSRAPGFTEPL